MKKRGVRFVFAGLVVIVACLFAGGFTSSTREQQEQEDLAKKTQAQQKAAPLQPASPQASLGARFRIGEFTVIVDAKPATSPGGAAIASGTKPQTVQPAVKTATGYAGQGHILIKGHTIRVTFSDIVAAPAKPGQIPVATAGTVQGSPGAVVEYTVEAFRVRLQPPSIRIRPDSATAAASVTLAQAPFMAAGADRTLAIASESCLLFPDGAVAGRNFRGSSAFLLRDSIYRLRIEPGVDQSVQLSKPLALPGRSRPVAEGVVLRGIASTSDSIDVFNYGGTVDANGRSARFDLSLSRTNYQTEPEPGYVLLLRSGTVNYNYGQDGTLNCAGEFNAQLTLPEAVKGDLAGRIVLDNIVLKTDETGALFNALTISARFRAGFSDVNQPGRSVFLIEPGPNSAFVYFPRWQAARNSSYTLPVTDQKKGPDCKALVDFLAHVGAPAAQGQVAAPKGKVRPTAPVTAPKSQLQPKAPAASPAVRTAPAAARGTAFRQNDRAQERNIYRRPGLTILQGTLHMKAPQASSPGTGAPLGGEFQLKTQVWSLVTATPWGLTGSVTSSACSFIPDTPDHALAECSMPSGTSRPGWTEILQAQARDPKGRPSIKKERFRLSDLRVLEMRLTRLDLCMNSFPEKGATMSSIVHFAFPTYIDIDFVDESLDAQGYFHTALGPVAPVTQPIAASGGPVSGQADTTLDPEDGSGIPRGPSNAAAGLDPLRTASQVSLPPMAKAKLARPIPQTYILWAWRLPITLTDRGVMITFPQGRGPAAVQVVMSSTADGEGNFTSSEIWLKPLFSKRSTVKQGVRVEASLGLAGEFRLTKWDTDPILCRTYPSPGTVPDSELNKGFASSIDAITLADAGATFNAEERDSDFGWRGKVTLPLFKAQPVTFGIKKLEPSMPQRIDLQRSGCVIQPCPVLDIAIRNLAFSAYQCHFSSTEVRFRNPGSADNAEYAAMSVEFSAFLNAIVIKNAARVKPWLELTEILAPGQSLTRHGLKDYVDGSGVIDLACYDADAVGLRGRLGLPAGCCLDNFKMGTYQVKQGDRIILSASKVRYYEGTSPVKLYLGGTAMELTPEGDGGAGGNKELLDIPGAELKLENGALFGDFDTDSLPAFLPNIRGECAFTLDTRNAYFSLLIGGSFPIVPFPINVEGVSFFFHAPRNQLDPILVKAAGWALYADVASMKTAVRMSDRDIRDTTVLSGVLLSGNAAVTAKFGPVEAMVQRGAGLFFYQYKNQGGPTGYNYGLFQNNRGAADVEFLTAEVVIDLTLAAESTQGSFDSIRSYFHRSDLAFTGTIYASACATCELAYARVDMKLDATYSVREGLTWTGIAPSVSVGLGGCH